MANGKNRVIEKDTGFKKLMKSLSVLGGYEVVVGIPKDAGEQPRGKKGVPLIKIAAAHEYGGPNNNPPERSFLRATFDANRAKYAKMQDEAAKAVLKNEDPRKALFKLGNEARNDVLDRINAGIDPPLADSTVARKGSSLQLVDKGVLRASITAIVRKETKDA